MKALLNPSNLKYSPILIFVFFIFLFIKYKKVHDSEINVVVSKAERFSGDGCRINDSISLPYIEAYKYITVGDSVVKYPKSDSIIVYRRDSDYNLTFRVFYYF